MSPSHCHRQATAAKTQEEIDAEDGEMGFLPIVVVLGEQWYDYSSQKCSVYVVLIDVI